MVRGGRAKMASSTAASRFQHTPFYCEENVYFLCKKLSESGMADAGGSDLFVVFISNENKQIPLWHQKASKRADGVILWDYHVICIQIKRDGVSPHLVWDLDSSLPFPSPLPSYVSETIRPSFHLFSEYKRFGVLETLMNSLFIEHFLRQKVDTIVFLRARAIRVFDLIDKVWKETPHPRCFRIVHAPIFLRYFASDRRHMKDSHGNWIAEPPTYAPIVAEDGTRHNLDNYLEIRASDELPNLGSDLVNSIYSQELGVVISESQLEGLFSQIS